jgi:hypothetical protein
MYNKILVLQKAVACSIEPYRSIFLNMIGPNLERLKSQNFGVKLHTKLLTTYPELNSFLSPNIINFKNKKNPMIGKNSNQLNYINQINNQMGNKINNQMGNQFMQMNYMNQMNNMNNNYNNYTPSNNFQANNNIVYGNSNSNVVNNLNYNKNYQNPNRKNYF